jgi:hypothetical protein
MNTGIKEDAKHTNKCCACLSACTQEMKKMQEHLLSNPEVMMNIMNNPIMKVKCVHSGVFFCQPYTTLPF